MIDYQDYFETIDEKQQQVEKNKAQELRKSQWWKNKRASRQCYYCQQSFPAKTLTMDHKVPIIRGGKSTKSNIVVCCKECNTKKKYLLPIEWTEYLERQLKQDDHELK